MSTVQVKEAQVRLSELIREAVEGREVVIAQEDGTAVRLVPTSSPRPRFGSAHGLFTMADDFDAPLTDFEQYEQ